VPAANWGQVRCTRRKIKRQPSRVRNFCQWKKTFFWAYPRQHLTLSHSFVFFPPRWWFCFLCRLIFYIPTDFFYLIGRFFRFTRACRHLQYHRVFFWIFRISAGSSLRQFRLASLFFREWLGRHASDCCVGRFGLSVCHLGAAKCQFDCLPAEASQVIQPSSVQVAATSVPVYGPAGS